LKVYLANRFLATKRSLDTIGTGASRELGKNVGYDY